MLLLFFKEHPSRSALCCDISVELSPFAVKSMFWLRSGPITLQEITYPDLVVAPLATASTDNTLLDLHNSSYDTKAEFNSCFIIHSK